MGWGDPTEAQPIVIRVPREPRTSGIAHSVLLTPNGPDVGRVVIRFTKTGPRTVSFRLALTPFSHVDDLTVVLAKWSD